MTNQPKYKVRENIGFAACVSKFSVLRDGKIVHRCDEIGEAHDFIASHLPPVRMSYAIGLTGSYPADTR